MFEMGDRVYVWKEGKCQDIGEVGVPTETHVLIKSQLSDSTAIYDSVCVYHVGTGPILTEPEEPFDDYGSDINWCKEASDYVKRGNRVLKIMDEQKAKIII